jgi:TBC1 domain family protein 5
VIIDPLSREKEQSNNNNNNPWSNYFEDAELRKQIKIDVERTFQEREFFKNLRIKKELNNILFTWSKNNAHISYKQGMNELAAILGFVCYTENLNEKDSEALQ